MKLIIKQYGKNIQEIVLEADREYFLGRFNNCDICLEEPDLSRKHLKIYQSAESKLWQIESLAEQSGLYFAGREISSFEVNNSCVLSLKSYTLNFIDENSQVNVIEEEQTLPGQTLIDKPQMQSLEKDKGEEATQVLSMPHLLYCLRISIEGEFSDYINLSLGEKWVIGRSEDCDVSINYDLLTRRHLEIEKKDNHFFLKDLGSANKTYLNGQDLKSHKEYLLQVNDEISIADLKIVFEVRDTDYEDRMKNLPAALSSEEEEEAENPLGLITPKLILEDFTEEELEKSSVKKSGKRRAWIILSCLAVLAGAGFYILYQDREKKKQSLAQEQQEDYKKLQMDLIYQDIQKNLQAGDYMECIVQVESLHEESPLGFYEDSQQLLRDCQNGLTLVQQKKAEAEAERRRLETEAEIKKLADHCQVEFDKGRIKTDEELNSCAGKLVDLDPNNEIVSQIRILIADRELKRQLAQEKRENYRKWIQSKKALYNKAKKLQVQNRALKAVSAYNVFLKSARGVAGLKELYAQAESERDQIQNAYDSELKSLRDSCEALTANDKFKEAYLSCKRVLGFKNYDKMALDNIEIIKENLKQELGPLYKDSQWHESFSRVKEAKKLWQEILDKDIKDGYYYKKAEAQIQKYK